jgi:octaprenyl-diphosphate synthase
METTKTEPMSRLEALALIAADLQRVEKAIGTDTICSVDAITAISQHLQSSGGKRLRPALLLLAAGACEAHRDAPIRMAAVMEIIHTATLVHDDVIDEADVRRGRPSTNQKWGNQVSVLAGDWLYMQAFNLAVQERNFYVLDLLIDLTQMMVEGELLQSEMIGRIDITEQQHQDLIHRKTACLFSVCTRLGAILAEKGEDIEQRLRDYGWNLGMAFQLIDDVLDFEASEAVLGKPVGNDLKEGKVTLPLILALNSCNAAERAEIETVVREGGYESVSSARVLEIATKYGAISEVRRRAVEYCEVAVNSLDTLPDTRYKRALASATDWIVDRQS